MMRYLNSEETSNKLPFRFINSRKILKARIKQLHKLVLTKLNSRKRLMSKLVNLMKSLSKRKRKKNTLNNSIIPSENWTTSSKKLMMRMKDWRKLTKTPLTKEIFSEHSLSEEMMSLLFCTKRSRFFKISLQLERFNIKKDLKILDFWSSRLVTIRVSSESWNLKLPKSRISEMKSSIFKNKLLKRNSKLKLCLRSLRIHWIFTDGESLKALILIPGKCSKRFKLFKEDSSRKLKKLSRRMLSFKRKKNSMLS